MKIKDNYTILSNKEISNNVYEMILRGNTSAIKNPGEFVQVTVPGVFLPRPFGIAYYDTKDLIIIYRVVGSGTEIMAKMKSGEQIEILSGCGNGFDLSIGTKKPILIGGGTGVAPLYNLALKLKEKGIMPTIILGFKTKDDAIYYEKFNSEFKTYLTLEDSDNERLVTDVLKKLTTDDYDYFYACGPKPMLKAVNDIALTEGEFSLESRMACGIGQCKCCSIETEEGMKTLCKDGPVIKKGLIRW